MWKRRMLARERRKRERERPKPVVEEKSAERPRPVADAIIEAMPIGVAVFDLEGKSLQKNTAAEKMFGYKEVGLPIDNFVIREDVPRALEVFQEAVKKGYYRGFECNGIAKDGRKFPILVDGTLLKDAEGEPSSIIIALRDITDLKRAELEFRRDYKMLAGLERAKAFTFTLFKDVCEPILKECKPETIARVKEIVQKVGERAPIVRGAKIADDGSVSFDEASFREAMAGSPTATSASDVVSTFSDIVVDECYPVIKADLGDEKASVALSKAFSTVFEKPGVAPYKPDLLRAVPEGVEIPSTYRVLEAGKSYLVEERTPEHAFAIFSDMVNLGFPGLCISTAHPSDVKADYELKERATGIWISKAEKEYAVSPSSLGILRDRIVTFIERNENGVVLLDGFEYLVTTNGFDMALKFLHHVREDVVLNRARIIVPISPVTLSERELGLLERNTETIEVVEKE